MMDEDKLQREANRASRAQALLNDPLLVEGFDKLEAEYTKAWRETNFRDDDARQRLWQAVNLLGKIRDHLGKVLANGKLAQAQIKAMSKTRESA
jgi:hypothetical protein